MKVLALDLALRFGWALGRESEPLAGSRRLLPGPVGNDVARAMSVLWDWLDEMMMVTSIDALAWEAPIMIPGRAHGTEKFLFGLASTAALFAYRKGLKPLEANVNTVRAKVVGNGHCGKEGVYAYCVRRGWRPVDDNDADARVLLVYAEAWFNRTPIAPPQREMAI